MNTRTPHPRRSSATTVFLCVLCVAALATAAPIRHSRVVVRLDAPGAETALRANPGLDVVSLKAGSYAVIVAAPKDIAWLDGAGLAYDVVQPDLESFYASRAKGLNFGAFHTYSEAMDWLDQMHAEHPDVVSAKWSLGQTIDGHDLWCVRVSDNPDVHEDGEPEILFDGMHHAREVMASEMVLMLVDYLSSHYGSDPTVTWLLDNREVYCVPIVNPDGFVYNETTDPSGGGMWRKNRRDNGDGTYGVDPNRNYPFQWVGSGSSTYTYDETYRGPSPGSELETQAMMNLINSHAFVVGQSFHTYSNLTMYPWGYTSTDSPDAALFAHMAGIMVSENGYEPGQPADVLYGVNGSSIDWFYGATTEHPRCLAFTTEIGGSADGFWPDETRRQPLFDENLMPSLYLIEAAGMFVSAHDPVVVGGDGDGVLDAGESAGLSFTVENLGVAAGASDVSVTLSCDDPYVQLQEAQRDLGALAALGTIDVSGAPFAVTVDPVLPPSHVVPVRVTVSADGESVDFTLNYPAGDATVLFADDFESGLGAWNTTGAWATVTAQSHSPTHSLHDSPTGNYPNNSSTQATLASPLSLSAGASLSFWHRFDIESGWDYGYVQVSTDGASWTTLASYTGTQSSWRQEQVDLGAYAGQDVWLRFRLETDYSITYDGWYVDDVSVTSLGSSNRTPPPPALVSPYDGGGLDPTGELTATESSDPDGAGPVTYGFRVYRDALCTDVAARADGLTSPAFHPEALEERTYWWRAYAADDAERGALGDVWSFDYSLITAVGDGLGGFGLRVLGPVTGGSAGIRLDLPRAGDLAVTVYNARGQAIRRLYSGASAAGPTLLTWNGRDDAGRRAPSGVYFVRAVTGNESRTGRVVMVR